MISLYLSAYDLGLQSGKPTCVWILAIILWAHVLKFPSRLFLLVAFCLILTEMETSFALPCTDRVESNRAELILATLEYSTVLSLCRPLFWVSWRCSESLSSTKFQQIGYQTVRYTTYKDCVQYKVSTVRCHLCKNTSSRPDSIVIDADASIRLVLCWAVYSRHPVWKLPEVVFEVSWCLTDWHLYDIFPNCLLPDRASSRTVFKMCSTCLQP